MKEIPISVYLGAIALVFNFVTLLFVYHQNRQNRVSLQLMKKSFDQDHKTRQISMFQYAHLIFEVMMHFDKWDDDINDWTKKLKRAYCLSDASVLREASQQPPDSPRGLADKELHDRCPSWLGAFYISEAQYYYSFWAPCSSLWLHKDEKPFWRLAQSLISRGEEYSGHLKELKSYIDEAVPEAYALSPARISDWKFFDA
jgi:hypothetical protein